jgi:hypothetical protein
MIVTRYPSVTGYSKLSALTPYPIPEKLRNRKVVNLGDGFILRAIERLLGRFPPQQLFSPRVAPSPETLVVFDNSPAVILAGANQLNDRYTVWPGLTGSQIRASKIRFVPFGIGLHGEAGFTDGLSDESIDVLRAVHERIEYSSWRCPHTVAFLQQQLPELSAKILMTGCPVTYDKPLLEDQPFKSATRRIAVTVTERQDFWRRETAVIDFVARQFRRSQRYLVLHQNYSPPGRFEHIGHRLLPQEAPSLDPYQKLRRYAVKRGFRVFCPADADECIKFYSTIDFHIGSRLHAHLLFLSTARRSLLVPVDGRSAGMSEFLGFPLCAPGELEAALDFDFEIVRERAKVGFSVMQQFIKSIPS